MHITFPVTTCLTEPQYSRIRALADDDRDLQRQSTDVGFLAPGEILADATTIVNDHMRLRCEAEHAAEIERRVFSRPGPGHRSEYDEMRVVSSSQSLLVLAQAFQAVAGHHSGMAVPIAQLMVGVLNNPNVAITSQAVKDLLLSGILSDPQKIPSFTDLDSRFPSPEIMGSTRLAFDRLMISLFGVYPRDNEFSGIVSNAADPKVALDTDILKVVVDMAIRQGGQTSNQSERALAFIRMAKENYPGSFDNRDIQDHIDVRLISVEEQSIRLNECVAVLKR